METFLKELPVAVQRGGAPLAALLGPGPPLDRRLQLRELQTLFVYASVLSKKCKVGRVGRAVGPSEGRGRWPLSRRLPPLRPWWATACLAPSPASCIWLLATPQPQSPTPPAGPIFGVH